MSSPNTPRHSRQSSAIDGFSDSPLNRRQSHGFGSPFRNSLNQQDVLDLNGDGGGGMGNLADELGGAFSGSEDGDFEDDEEADQNGVDSEARGSPIQNGRVNGNRRRETDLSVPSGGHHRRTESNYDGSEYGSESDLDTGGVPPSLISKIDGIESLARRGTEKYGGPEDDVVQRLTDGLRDLGSQSGVESSTSRLITAHSALTTHLAHQTRQLHNLTFPLLAPMASTPDSDAIDELVPLLLSLSDSMPRPSTTAFESLASLHGVTSDLVQTLNYLSDTLQMSRQTTTMATRRLKSAKELVAEVRRDEELRDEGERWLTQGNWGERLQNRECAGVCGDVIGGFEEVCNGWRERLLAQAQSQA
ncbi:unnamed protein product [Clonostachys byssicola]|uniref:Uncharacterized protein n=1 Tax=Clonostachys byssicola TaxID=160290 RepID=A0A9N9Y7Z7_9HYPO|nr:unnamed protein product [Clonostachys byssicola]